MSGRISDDRGHAIIMKRSFPTRWDLRLSRVTLLCMVTTFQCLVAAQEANAAIHRFRVRLSKTIATQPFTGRVYIFFSDQMPREPRLDFKFIKAEPFVALDIENWKPGETITFTSDQPDGMLAYPVPLAEMKLDGFRAQAVARLNPFDPEVGGGEGNGYGPAVLLPADDSGGELLDLVVDRVVPEYPFNESKWCKLLRVRSKLLSDFYGRDVSVNAAVILPASYHEQ